jgi:hypothetical protein
MPSSAPELSSLAATIEELVHRLAPIGTTYEQEDRDDLAGGVHEVERLLGTALRRLNRLIGTPGA